MRKRSLSCLGVVAFGSPEHFLSLTLPVSLCLLKCLLTSLWDTFNTLAMSIICVFGVILSTCTSIPFNIAITLVAKREQAPRLYNQALETQMSTKSLLLIKANLLKKKEVSCFLALRGCIHSRSW